jgi:GGDEF domain-containing protein
VAAFSGDAQMSSEEIYRIADERLYAAKNAGRNRVV